MRFSVSSIAAFAHILIESRPICTSKSCKQIQIAQLQLSTLFRILRRYQRFRNWHPSTCFLNSLSLSPRTTARCVNHVRRQGRLVLLVSTRTRDVGMIRNALVGLALRVLSNVSPIAIWTVHATTVQMINHDLGLPLGLLVRSDPLYNVPHAPRMDTELKDAEFFLRWLLVIHMPLHIPLTQRTSCANIVIANAPRRWKAHESA
jgi:hypothetical protein